MAERARVWWNGQEWESYVPGDRYSFVDASWGRAMHWAELGMYALRLRGTATP